MDRPLAHLLDKVEACNSIIRDNAVLLLSQRSVCQYPFRKNDIVWICRNCQKDETCVLCNSCFHRSCHVGHDVFFYHSQSGGCCDCGDSGAWNEDGFCSLHGIRNGDPLAQLPPQLQRDIREAFSCVIEDVIIFIEAYARGFDGNTDTPILKSWEDGMGIMVKKHDGMDRDDFLRVLYPFFTKHSVGPLDPPLTTHERCERIWSGISLSGQAIIDGSDMKVGEFAENNESDECNWEFTTPAFAGQTLLWVLRSRNFQASFCRADINERSAAHCRALGALFSIAQQSDALCRSICNTLVPTLPRVLDVSLRLGRDVSKQLLNLFLTLMADQGFKMDLAVAYSQAYRGLCKEFNTFVGLQEVAIFSLSVQFLNRDIFVTKIVDEHGFLSSIVDSLKSALLIINRNDVNMVTNIVMHKRYSVIITDLKIVSVIESISRRIAETQTKSFLQILKHFHGAHSQTRELVNHVLHEAEHWMSYFNLYLHICSLFDSFLHWQGLDSGSVGGGGLLSSMLLDINGHIIDVFSQRGNAHIGRTIVLDTALDLYSSEPHKFDFHPYLNRFLAAAVDEACKHPSQTTALDDFLHNVAAEKLNVAMLDSLNCLVFAAQVRQQLWRRNGQVMIDQVHNYADTHCRSYRDLDLLFIQLCLAECVKDTADAGRVHSTLAQLLYSYNALHHLLGLPEESDMFSAGQRDKLSEEAVDVLIVLVTELPLPPSTDARERLHMLCRREIVHRLCMGGATYSELYDCCIASCGGLTGSKKGIRQDQMDLLLAELADSKRAGSAVLDSEKMALKPELWSLYDPSFYHLSFLDHESIRGRRPKITTPQPLAPPPPRAHPLFSQIRIRVLSCELLQTCLHRLLATFSRAKGTTDRETRAFECSESMLLKVFHLLTLLVHELSLDEHTSSRAELASAVFLKERVISKNLRDRNTFFELQQIQGSDFDDVRPHVLCCLVDISDSLRHSEGEEDGRSRLGLEWLYSSLAQLSPACGGYINSRVAKRELGEQKINEGEARKRQARERAMASIASSANAFLAFGDIEDSDGEMEPRESCELQCIICRSADPQDMCYMGFIQLSTCRGGPSKATINNSLVLNDSPCIENLPSHISLCGHAIHSQCFDTYYAEVLSKYDRYDGMILSTRDGEFPCPLCRRLHNILVPKFISCTASSDALSVDSSSRGLGVGLAGGALALYVRESAAAGGDEGGGVQASACYRMLREFSKMYYPLDDFPSHDLLVAADSRGGDNGATKPIVSLLLLAARGVWFTVVADEAEQSGLLRSSAYETEEMHFSTNSIDGIAECLKIYEKRAYVHRYLKTILKGTLQSEDETFVGRLHTDCLYGCLLGCHLGERLVLALACERSSFARARSAVTCICLARLAQIAHGCVASSNLPEKHDAAMRELLRYLQSSAANGIDASTSDGQALLQWLAFLRCAAAMLYRYFRPLADSPLAASCPEFAAAITRAGDFAMDKKGDGSLPAWALLAHLHLLDLQSLLSSTDAASVLPGACAAWFGDLIMCQPHFDSTHQPPVAFALPAALVPALPTSYTSLHATVSMLCPHIELPAICLVCGTVLDASGNGSVTAHVSRCSPGNGIVFLVHDCQTLLFYQKKCCYFPPFYVDSHGESKQNMHGRPLYLHLARLEFLRSLYATHSVAREVYYKRSSSNRVIVLGHY